MALQKFGIGPKLINVGMLGGSKLINVGMFGGSKLINVGMFGGSKLIRVGMVIGPKLIDVGMSKGPKLIKVGHIIGPKLIRLHTGKGPKLMIVGNVGIGPKSMIVGKTSGPKVMFVGKLKGPKVMLVGRFSGPKLMVLQKLGIGPNVITVGIGGSTTIIDGMFIGPSGPMSKHGNTIGGGCMFTVGNVMSGMFIWGMSGMFGIMISNGGLVAIFVGSADTVRSVGLCMIVHFVLLIWITGSIVVFAAYVCVPESSVVVKLPSPKSILKFLNEPTTSTL